MTLQVNSPPTATATLAVTQVATGAARRIAGVSTSLLPEPGAGGLSGTQDSLAMMYDLVAKQGEITLALGQATVTDESRQEQAQLNQERHAEQAQEQADANAGGFWHDICSIFEDIGKIAGVVAAAAATVVTCGTAGVAAVATAAVLISAGLVVSATRCLGKESGFFGMGLEVAGSILTMGAASSVVASNALSSVAQVVNSAAQVTSGVSTVATGVATVEVDKFESESEDDGADVQQALNAINRQGRLVSEIVEGLKSSQQSNQNALKIIAGAAQTYGRTSALAASGGKA
jgi:hypothetical protein